MTSSFIVVIGGIIILAGLILLATPSSSSPYGSPYGNSSGCFGGIVLIGAGLVFTFVIPDLFNKVFLQENAEEGVNSHSTSDSFQLDQFNWGLLGWVVLGTTVLIMLLILFGKIIPYIREQKREQEHAASEEYARIKALDNKYNNIRARMQTITDDYLQRELSPETILFSPLILDVNYEPTRTFQNNFKISQEYFEKIQDEKLDDIDFDELEDIVDTTEKSWYNLIHKASNIGFPLISEDTSKKAQKMMQVVINESSQPGERIAYAERLVKLLEDEKKNFKPYQIKQKKEFSSLVNVVSSRIMDASKDGKMPSRLQANNLLAIES